MNIETNCPKCHGTPPDISLQDVLRRHTPATTCKWCGEYFDLTFDLPNIVADILDQLESK